MNGDGDAGPRYGTVVLFDGRGRMALRSSAAGEWTLPRACARPGQDVREAVLREVESLTGSRPQRLRYVGQLDDEATAVFIADDEVEITHLRFHDPAEAVALPAERWVRRALALVASSDKYQGEVQLRNGPVQAAAVLALDRWGRVLLQLRDDDLPADRYPSTWSLPGGIILPGESPDAAAFREFEEETGHLLEELKLFRVYGPEPPPGRTVERLHVFYFDADLDEANLEVREGQALRYVGPAEIGELQLTPMARRVLEGFFMSPAYKAMFH